MSVLILAEHDNQTVNAATYHTLSAALELKKSIQVVLLGSGLDKVRSEIASLKVDTLYYADATAYQHQLAEDYAAIVCELLNQNKDIQYILAPATTFGKNILPRIAGMLSVGQISDVTKIVAEDTFEHPIYAGNALETVKTSETIKLLTIRTTAFSAYSIDDAKLSGASEQKVLESKSEQLLSRHISTEATELDRPELTSARVVVSGGRGLQSKENFQMIEKLADKLNAAIGASRAAVDAGYVPNDYQVGQTGKIVAPELYIAIGISGAIQHLAGMKDSKIIVAINKDPEAPIFQISDYGLVGDLHTLVPELIEQLG